MKDDSDKQGKFLVTEKAEMTVKRKCFALASLGDKYVFATGGLQSSDYAYL